MIRSFKHRGLKRFYEHGDRSKLPATMMDRIVEILTALDSAKHVREMDLPHYRLHTLSGGRKGEWAVTVLANWRIVFRFDDEPENVDFVDYH